MTVALTKVVYSVLESKYGGGCAKKKLTPPSSDKKKGNNKKKGKRGSRDDDSESEEYDVNEDQSYVSDDSRCASN